MDQLDRGSRQRLAEETARHQLAEAERDRDRARLIGYVEDESHGRRLLLGIILAAALLVLVLMFYAAMTEPRPLSTILVDEPAWGTATHETTLVRPPAWWLIEP